MFLLPIILFVILVPFYAVSLNRSLGSELSNSEWGK